MIFCPTEAGSPLLPAWSRYSVMGGLLFSGASNRRSLFWTCAEPFPSDLRSFSSFSAFPTGVVPTSENISDQDGAAIVEAAPVAAAIRVPILVFLPREWVARRERSQQRPRMKLQ